MPQVASTVADRKSIRNSNILQGRDGRHVEHPVQLAVIF